MFLNNTFLYQCNSFFYISTEVLNLFKNKILRTRLFYPITDLILIRPSIKATRDDADHVEGKRRNGIDHQNSKACTTLPRTRQAAFIVEKREREKGKERRGEGEKKLKTLQVTGW